jgi:hypothetical protein
VSLDEEDFGLDEVYEDAFDDALVECPRCCGTGITMEGFDCEYCDGTGEIEV